MATRMVLASSFRSLVLVAMGNFTSTPFWSMGVMTMKMMRRAIMMSAMGVTLMSAMAAPFLPPPTAIDMGRLLRALLDEVVEQLRAGVVHLDVEALDLAREVVVRPHRRHRHEQAEGGGDERLRDTGRDGGDAARAGEGHAREGVDDPEGGAEQPHERRGGPDGGQARQPALEVGQVHGRRALDGPLGRVDRRFLVALHLAGLDLVLPLLEAENEDLGQVGVLHVLAVGDV